LETEARRRSELRDLLIAGVLDRVPRAQLRGAPGQRRLPGHAPSARPDPDSGAPPVTLDAGRAPAAAGSARPPPARRPRRVPLRDAAERPRAAFRPSPRRTTPPSSTQEAS